MMPLAIEEFLKKFNPGQPRVPSGRPTGGQWSGMGQAATALVGGIQARADQNAQAAIQDLANQWSWYLSEELDGPVDADPAEVKRMLDEAWDKSELIVAFSPHAGGEAETDPMVQESMAKDPHIRNMHETGRTEYADPDIENRKAYERNAFGDEMDSMPDQDKPKYGSIAWDPQELPVGEVAYYGSAAMVLNKQTMADRTTYSPVDSAEGLEVESTARTPYAAMAKSPAALKAAGFPDSFIRSLQRDGEVFADDNMANGANLYDEIHVFGKVPITPKHVEKIRVMDQSVALNDYYADLRRRASAAPSVYDASKIPADVTREQYYAGLFELSRKTGVPLEFVEPY